MRTKASIKGHPVHAMLVPFPVAFFTGVLIFDLLTLINMNFEFWQTSIHLTIAGIISAFAAAVPGYIDFQYSVPPNSSARKRASTHMLINLSVVAAFYLSYLFKSASYNEVNYFAIALDLISVVALSFSGWMGGTLVTRNFIGPDHRYAHSTKWKEENIKSDEKLIKVADNDELKKDQMKLVIVNGNRIVIGRSESGYSAFEDHCTHRGGSLAGGVLICDTVQCLWHGSQFNIKTGEVKAGPAENKIKIYGLEENDNGIFLKL